MPYKTSLLRVEGRLLDLDRRLEIGKTARLFLIKRGVEQKRFVLVREITEQWSIRWSEWRGEVVVLVGAADTTFPDEIISSSFVAYGEGRGEDNDTFDVFQLNPERKEVIPPVPKTPFWKAYCLVTSQRYVHVEV